MVKVLVAGFKGRMGNTTVQMVLEHEDFELVGVFDPCAKEKNLNENAEYKDTDVPVYVRAKKSRRTPKSGSTLLRQALFLKMRSLLWKITSVR